MYYLSFPGLGIEPFHIDKVAFSVFGRDVAWYGLLITCGMVLAVLWAIHLAKFEGISFDDITDFAFIVIVCGVIGARLYYVIFSWDSYGWVTAAVSDGTFLSNILTFFRNLWATFVSIIAIWNGGLAIYGGVIAGLITAFVYSKLKKGKVPFIKLFDILVPCVLIGQVIGRWGNFINVEAYGSETTLPWRMGIHYAFSEASAEIGLWSVEKFVHPTFLYESLWNLIGLCIIIAIYKKKKFDGQIFCCYLIWYGFGRMLIEGLRTDSLMIGALRVSQCVGAASVILGITLMVLMLKRTKAKAAEIESAEAYKPVYEEPNAGSEEKNNEENKTEE
ncbi:MAG: prolipoprotein diacylglyceryl transferase [Clostridia bacterium]|nr:prolipoprotein diacylglyceryl transferase [Clostridia bacterium]